MPTLGRRALRHAAEASLLCLGATHSLFAQTQPPAATPAPVQPAVAASALPIQTQASSTTQPSTPPDLPPAPPGYRYVQVAPAQPAQPVAPAQPGTSGDYQPAFELPYTVGAPVPRGYRLVEEPIYGLVVAGWVLTGVSYGISVMAATSADFKNESTYLLVPFAGPWLMMGRREYGDCSRSSSDRDALRCTADVFVVMGLIMDGMLQAGGGAMLLSGYLAQRKKLVRSDFSWNIGPRGIGTGYGLSATGTF